MKKKESSTARRFAALKGWRTRRRHERERSERARRGWQTRRRNERKRARAAKAKRARKPAARKETPQEWAITYDYGEKGKAFAGELRFYSRKSLTNDEAVDIASDIFAGRKPRGITYKSFELRGKEEDATDGFEFAEGFPGKARKAGPER